MDDYNGSPALSTFAPVPTLSASGTWVVAVGHCTVHLLVECEAIELGGVPARERTSVLYEAMLSVLYEAMLAQ